MAPICSVEPNMFHDPTCLLTAGDHPFTKHESYVAYAKCRVEAAADIVKLTDTGYFTVKELASEALVARIVAGLGKSKFSKPFARDFYRDYEQSLKPPKSP